MITGRINQGRELVVRVEVSDRYGQILPVACVVDTGFTNELTLPPAVIRRLDLEPANPVSLIAANDEILRLDTYRGTVLWQGRRRPVRIIEAEGAPLLGIGLLWGSLLTAAITDNGEVTISPLPDAPPAE